jgi:hypothetical protein
MPDLIPAEYGIFDRHPEKLLDSGSPLRFGRNDGCRDNDEMVHRHKGVMAMAAQGLVHATEDLFVEGVRVRVETPGMLYRMKKNTVRPQDRVDGQVLKERFNLKEE